MVELPRDRLEVEVAEADELGSLREVVQSEGVPMIESRGAIDHDDQSDSMTTPPAIDLRRLFHREIKVRQDVRDDVVEEA